MKSLIIIIVLLFAAGCASIGEKEQEYEQDKKKSLEAIQQTDAFVLETKPKQVAWFRFEPPVHWEYLNNQYVIIETRKGKHLFRVRNYCPKLETIQDTSTPYMSDLADSRTSLGMLKVNSDKIRGCVIDAIYVLSDEAEIVGGEGP